MWCSLERGLITTSNVPQLLSSQMAHQAWTSAERAGVHTQPGSLGGSGEGNHTCLDERCCRWNGQSPDLHWGKRREGGMIQPPGPVGSPWHYAPAVGLAFYLEAANPWKERRHFMGGMSCKYVCINEHALMQKVVSMDSYNWGHSHDPISCAD